MSRWHYFCFPSFFKHSFFFFLLLLFKLSLSRFPSLKKFLILIFFRLEAHVCFLLSRHKWRRLLVTHRIIYARFSIQQKKKKNVFDPYFYSIYPQETEDFQSEQYVVWNGDTMNQTKPLILHLLNFKVMIFFLWWQADLNLNSGEKFYPSKLRIRVHRHSQILVVLSMLWFTKKINLNFNSH